MNRKILSGTRTHERNFRAYFLVIIGLSAAFSSLPAQKIYTKLTDEKQIEVFTKVSNGLVCQCGCNLVLSTCPHVECPWAIPARRFIEDRIRQGMGVNEILSKMERGFGDRILKDPRMIALSRAGRPDLARGFARGFGQKISAHTSSLAPILMILAFLGSAILLVLYWRRRGATGGPGHPPETNLEDSPPSSTDSKLDSALGRIKDLDQ